MASTKLHQVYRDSNDRIVPGASTVARLLDDGKMYRILPWAVKLALQGQDHNEVKKFRGDIGTCTHARIEALLAEKTPDLSDFSPNVVKESDICMEKYFRWWDSHEIELVATELQLVSDLGFGGTLDMIARIDGLLTLADWKTGFVGKEQWRQVGGGYRILAEQYGYKIEQVILVGLSSKPKEKPKEHVIVDTTCFMDTFRGLVDLYWKLEREVEA